MEEQLDLEDRINPLHSKDFKYPTAVTIKSELSASKSQSFNKFLKTENCGEKEMLISNQQTSYSPSMPKFDLSLRIKRREEPMPIINNKNQQNNIQTIQPMPLPKKNGSMNFIKVQSTGYIEQIKDFEIIENYAPLKKK